jgi:uncharacterized DUF497 family protein
VAGFIWTPWNLAHIAKHGITRAEVEYAQPPYPEHQGEEKFLVRGRTRSGRMIQVVFVLESSARGIDWTEVDLVGIEPGDEGVYVIHARPLTDAEKNRFRRRRR